MTCVEIEKRMLEIHNIHPVNRTLVGQVSSFLKALPLEQRLYAATYGVLLAKSKLRRDFSSFDDHESRGSDEAENSPADR